MIGGFDFWEGDAMDWSELQTQTLPRNIYFAYIRASHGLHPDGQYAAVRSGCDKVALLNAPYHFVMPNLDVDAQVALLVQQVTKLSPGSLPPSIDLEWTLKKDKKGNVTRPEYWKPIKPLDRIGLIKTFLEKVEKALGTTPAVYTATSFWNEFIVDVNNHADYDFIERYPLWLVDLKGTAKIPKPWKKAAFIQNHFGEHAPQGAPWYDHLDHDFFNGSVRELLDSTRAGFELSASASPPVSAVTRDAQAALKAHGQDPGPSDGRFGQNTAQALQAFQTKQGLNPTGKLDKATWQALLA